MNMNSGLFFTRANERTRNLMDRIAARLAKEAAWDQSVFNEEIFFLSHDDYVSPNISTRVMNYLKVRGTTCLPLVSSDFVERCCSRLLGPLWTLSTVKHVCGFAVRSADPVSDTCMCAPAVHELEGAVQDSAAHAAGAAAKAGQHPHQLPSRYGCA